LWQPDLRVDLASAEQVKDLPRRGKVTVVLSAHLVRYAVLPWTATLSGEDEWMAYARHTFASTYGAIAANWTLRLCTTGRRKPRVACAVDTALLDALAENRCVISVQPRLMAEFNARRKQFDGAPAWLVLQETDRLTISLFADAEWKFIRVRQARGDWRTGLPDLLARELATTGMPASDRVVLAEHQ